MFFCLPRKWVPVCSSPQKTVFSILLSDIWTTWPYHLSCALTIKTSMHVMLQHSRTSVFGIKSYHLIPTIYHRHYRWNWSKSFYVVSISGPCIAAIEECSDDCGMANVSAVWHCVCSRDDAEVFQRNCSLHQCIVMALPISASREMTLPR